MKKKRGLIPMFAMLILLGSLGYVTVYLNTQDTAPEGSEAAASAKWGLIANAGYADQKARSTLFFSGPPNNNEVLYTRHPKSAMWDWNDERDVDEILDEVAAANINVLKMSFWGYGSEVRFSPTNYTKAIHEEVIQKAKERNILVAPFIEVTPTFRFWEQYPSDTSVMENRIAKAISTFKPYDNWLQLYNRNGAARKVIWLIETIHLGSVNEQVFAQTFDTVANSIQNQTGEKVGFVIDPTPLPPNGSYNGPNCDYLKNTNSILAINPFNITSDGSNENARLTKAEQISNKWNKCKIPYMSAMLPGFDDHIVRQPSQIYGDNTSWRNEVKRIALQYEQVGISLDVWNGFTEGYVYTPTTEYDEINYNLAKGTLAEVQPECVNVQYANWDECPSGDEPISEDELRPLTCKIPSGLPQKDCSIGGTTTNLTTSIESTTVSTTTIGIEVEIDPLWSCERADINGDLSIDLFEISELVSQYNKVCSSHCASLDTNNDNIISVIDFSQLSKCFGVVIEKQKTKGI